MRRNLIAGVLIAAGLALMASALPGLRLVHLGSAGVVTTTAIPGLGDPLSPPHQHARFLPGIGSPGAAPSQAIAYFSIPRLGLKDVPVFDRGVDAAGNMLIARGYSITHFSDSAAIGSGNAVLYGHDDIEGSVFSRLAELKAGDEVMVTTTGGSHLKYRVTERTIVPPTAVEILKPTNDVRLTIFTCWPIWVDSHRVVLTAVPATG